jgi:hypothetical protein
MEAFNMSIDLYAISLCGMIFIPSALVVAWVTVMENEKFFQKIDQKIADEIVGRRDIDDSYGSDCLIPDVTDIRHNCKKENRYLFFIIFIASLASFFGGSIFILNSSYFY